VNLSAAIGFLAGFFHVLDVRLRPERQFFQVIRIERRQLLTELLRRRIGQSAAQEPEPVRD